MNQPYFERFPEAKIPDDGELLNLTCPRPSCSHEPLRIARTYVVAWGEEVMAQCDCCGMILRITNNVAMKCLVERVTESTLDVWHSTIEDAPEDWASNNPTVLARVKRKAKKQEEIAALVQCQACPVSFTPRSNAKSVLQTKFCPKCRNDGKAKSVLDAEAKKARKVAGGVKAAATRAKNAAKVKK